MKVLRLLAGTALALTSVWALAQNAPESLLPQSFNEPAPQRPAPAPVAPRAAGSGNSNSSSSPQPATVSAPVVQPLPGASAPRVTVTGDGLVNTGTRQLTLDELVRLSPDELEKALGLKPNFDIPPAARRSMDRIGVIDESEGGLGAGALASQNASLVRAALAGNNGTLVSRWGHILLRRVLASRLDTPKGMNPADFAALRAGLLVRMGEGDAARALVQDIDTGNYSPALVQSALDAYIATADFTGLCPAIAIHGGARKDAQWEVFSAICDAFRGDGQGSLAKLDRGLNRGTMPKIDMLLAQKYAGAAGKARRAVTIEWDEVKDMTPWRYGLAIAVGIQPPATLMKDAGPRYDYMAATAPMLGLPVRAAAADRAACVGILSSAAVVDLYSQIYAQEDITGEWSERAAQLRDAYAAADAPARLAAMQKLWNGVSGTQQRCSRQVLTAYAAARLPVNGDLATAAPDLIASMLFAGLDRNADRWAGVVEPGSQGWALLAVSSAAKGQVDSSAIENFHDDDSSEDARKSAFLVAGLAGLGRISADSAASLASGFGHDLAKQTRWSKLIDQAAAVDNAALVAILAGVGMQGDEWNRMTPRHLFHIVSALRRVGFEAEARMIAAEAVARG